MKKVLSILFALIILVSGMNLTFAMHICGGEVAGVKWSVSGELATCGMENSKASCPVHGVINTSCCHDKIVVCSVDGNYCPAFSQIKKPITNPLLVLMVPEMFSAHSLTTLKNSFTNRSPRDKLQISSVRLENICVFII